MFIIVDGGFISAKYQVTSSYGFISYKGQTMPCYVGAWISYNNWELELRAIKVGLQEALKENQRYIFVPSDTQVSVIAIKTEDNSLDGNIFGKRNSKTLWKIVFF